MLRKLALLAAVLAGCLTSTTASFNLERVMEAVTSGQSSW